MTACECVLNGLAHGAEKFQPVFERAIVPCTIVRQRNAFDVFHDEPWSAIGQSICIVKPRDGGVIELRERSLFGREAFAARRGKPGIPQNFDGDQDAEILAPGQIDDAHSAFAEYALDPVRTKFVKGSGRLLAQHISGDLRHIAIKQRRGARILIDHREHTVKQRLIRAAGCFEKRAAIGFRQVERIVKQRLHSIPTRAVHHFTVLRSS